MFSEDATLVLHSAARRAPFREHTACCTLALTNQSFLLPGLARQCASMPGAERLQAPAASRRMESGVRCRSRTARCAVNLALNLAWLPAFLRPEASSRLAGWLGEVLMVRVSNVHEYSRGVACGASRRSQNLHEASRERPTCRWSACQTSTPQHAAAPEWLA